VRDPRINPEKGDVVDGYRVTDANRRFVHYFDGKWTLRVPIRDWRNLVSPRYTITEAGRADVRSREMLKEGK
jgi:hypothetical protein